jgi:long-chain acyl-CoA synthetase
VHGYWRNEAETARVLKDGWLHTGDIGMIDEKGRIKITDRKKDIIVNDKGDNVARRRWRGCWTLQPEIMQAMIAGDRKPYMTAVIVPDPNGRRNGAPRTGPNATSRRCSRTMTIAPRSARRSSG